MCRMPSLEIIETTEMNPEELEQLTKQRDELFEEIVKIPAVQEAYALLDKLPPHLVYHVKEHTFGKGGVIDETILFALKDGISRGSIEMMVTAAAWHDVGYIEQDKGNEPIAVELFKNSVAYTQLDSDISEEIISNIIDTTVVFEKNGPHFKNTNSALSYVLDGDVSNFGRPDFRELSEKMKLEQNPELANREETVGEKIKRLDFTIKLLENHDWHTEGARMLREKQKVENLRELKKEYATLFAETDEAREKFAA